MLIIGTMTQLFLGNVRDLLEVYNKFKAELNQHCQEIYRCYFSEITISFLWNIEQPSLVYITYLCNNCMSISKLYARFFLFLINWCMKVPTERVRNLNISNSIYLINLTGGVAPSGHPDHPHNRSTCHHKKPPRRGFQGRLPNLVAYSSGCAPFGRRALHVSDQHWAYDYSDTYTAGFW